MNINTILTLALVVAIIILVLKTDPFRVWFRGRNKSDAQKKAIKFLIYGPVRSKITKEEYDQLCDEMYPDVLLVEKACKKLGISEMDLVTHPLESVSSKYLVVRNFVKEGEKVLVCGFDGRSFRSSRVDALMVLFGKAKLYFYQISYRSDCVMENEESFEYEYDCIDEMSVPMVYKDKNENVHSLIEIKATQMDGKEKKNIIKKFPKFVFGEEQYKIWKAVGQNLDSPQLREYINGRSNEDEKQAVRYFKAYYHLPLAMTDDEYEAMVKKHLPADDLRQKGIFEMDIQEKDIDLEKAIAFRSYIYSLDGRRLEVEGRDKNWRSSDPQHTWLFFGKHQIYVYTVSVGMDNSVVKVSTQDIFYKDIAGIRTEQNILEKKIGDDTCIMSYYTITVFFSGDRLTLSLPIMTEENDKKIRDLRNLVRENKKADVSSKSLEDEDMA